MLERFVHDLRYAMRTLRASLLVTIATVLTLGIGIGLLTAIFSLVNAAVLRPLPYPDARRLVALSEAHPREYSAFSEMSPAAFATVRDRSRSFSALGAYAPVSSNVVIGGSAQRVSGAEISAELFATLRVAPARGRVFTPDEAASGAHVVAISDELWRTRFGASDSVLGTAVRIDGTPYTILGVMSRGFAFPQRQQLWRPLVRRTDTAEWLDRSVSVAARLRDGVSLDAARAEVATIGLAFARDNSATQDEWTMAVRSEMIERRAIPGPLPWMVLAAGLFMLLIACANVTTVLLARAAARRNEMAVRAALGASRLRLMAQHLTETLLLALAGGALGVAISVWTLDAARALLPINDMPSWLDFGVDWRVLAFTLGASLVALVTVGLGPALTATRVNLSDPLKLGAAGDTASRRELRAGRAIVVAEVALAFVLFAGSVLMLQSFRGLRDVDLAIDSARVLTAWPQLSESTYGSSARRAAYLDAAVERVRRVSGGLVVTRGDLDSLRGTTVAMDSVQRNREGRTLVVRGADQPAGSRFERADVSRYVVGPEYFRVVGVPITRGRAFDARDGAGGSRVAVVSQVLADKLWPARDAVGKQFRFGGMTEWVTVVGVARSVLQLTGRNGALAPTPQPAVYLPAAQATSRNDVILVRASGDPMVLASAVRRALSEVDPDQAVVRVERLSDESDRGANRMLWLGVIFATIAAGALVLASIGLYGVISYSVARRTREIGVRMALGADAVALQRAVLGQALRLTGIGLAVGVAAAWGFIRLIDSFLYGVTAYDPLTYAAVMSLFIAIGAAASYVPARRATRVDPLIALRAQ